QDEGPERPLRVESAEEPVKSQESLLHGVLDPVMVHVEPQPDEKSVHRRREPVVERAERGAVASARERDELLDRPLGDPDCHAVPVVRHRVLTRGPENGKQRSGFSPVAALAPERKLPETNIQWPEVNVYGASPPLELWSLDV